ncbi:MAG: 30S ribosomal protein S4 [Patescibacteria group bacterium]|nr:30S ribosomal protein S4 [Patescibacteria group bacterium]
MRYIGPKNRVTRRENMDLGFKTPGSNSHASMMRRLNILPGQHGAARRRKVSERGRQLREKQKLKSIFGLSERQLSNYFKKASRQKGNTAQNLVRLLESRLDNVVFRMGFAPTRAAARQLVSHKHILVNGKPVSIPSYHLHAADVVSFARESSAKIPAIEAALARPDIILPVWLETKGTQGRLLTEPATEDMEKQLNLRLVIEYYSK